MPQQRARQIVVDRLALWESHGGEHQLAAPYSHLTIEGELRSILRSIDARESSTVSTGGCPRSDDGLHRVDDTTDPNACTLCHEELDA